MSDPLSKQVDEMMDAYVDWREACILVSDAYRWWSIAAGPDATVAFGWYMTALDREERTAEIYASLTVEIRELVAS